MVCISWSKRRHSLCNTENTALVHLPINIFIVTYLIRTYLYIEEKIFFITSRQNIRRLTV